MTHAVTVFTICPAGSQSRIHNLPHINIMITQTELCITKKGSISNSEQDLCFIHAHCAFEYCVLENFQGL